MQVNFSFRLREARGENVAEMKSADSEEEKRVSSKQIEDSYQVCKIFS